MKMSHGPHGRKNSSKQEKSKYSSKVNSCDKRQAADETCADVDPNAKATILALLSAGDGTLSTLLEFYKHKDEFDVDMLDVILTQYIMATSELETDEMFGLLNTLIWELRASYLGIDSDEEESDNSDDPTWTYSLTTTQLRALMCKGECSDLMAIANHPDNDVRVLLVDYLSPDNDEHMEILKHLARDKSCSVKTAVARKNTCLDILIESDDEDVFVEIANHGAYLGRLVIYDDSDVRAAVAKQGYRLETLVKDESATVRAACVRFPEYAKLLWNDPSKVVQRELGKYGYTSQPYRDMPHENKSSATFE